MVNVEHGWPERSDHKSSSSCHEHGQDDRRQVRGRPGKHEVGGGSGAQEVVHESAAQRHGGDRGGAGVALLAAPLRSLACCSAARSTRRPVGSSLVPRVLRFLPWGSHAGWPATMARARRPSDWCRACCSTMLPRSYSSRRLPSATSLSVSALGPRSCFIWRWRSGAPSALEKWSKEIELHETAKAKKTPGPLHL